MQARRLWTDRTKFFLLGASVALGGLFLLGAEHAPPGPPHYGRYQISAWSTRLGEDTGGVGVFIVDTATGETKTAYTAIYGKPRRMTVVVDHLGKPFGTIPRDTSPPRTIEKPSETPDD
jgi:hypothetical protein